MTIEFNEDLLQFVWQYKLLGNAPLYTRSGKALKILSPGELNVNAGPDFFNARILLNELTLAGNVEIHLRSSDWLKHGHQHDSDYNTLVLHVVYVHDCDIAQNRHFEVEVLELLKVLPEETILRYRHLMQTRKRIPCENQLAKVNDLAFQSWLERMVVERLEEKVNRIRYLFRQSQRNYPQTFYLCLMRNFGFNVNAEPFELLSKHLPLTLLLKHADRIQQLEALLLGTAGMLNDQYTDPYLHALQNEYEFLRSKYQLVPLPSHLFKFSRLRPANFPSLRLVQFAGLLHTQTELFCAPHRYTTYDTLIGYLKINPGTYWQNHYHPGGKERHNHKGLGIASIENLLVNSFAPFFMFYSQQLGQEEYKEHALALLAACSFESNTKTKLFMTKKAVLRNAADSQGLIRLLQAYCQKKKCLTCGIGYQILKNH